MEKYAFAKHYIKISDKDVLCLKLYILPNERSEGYGWYSEATLQELIVLAHGIVSNLSGRSRQGYDRAGKVRVLYRLISATNDDEQYILAPREYKSDKVPHIINIGTGFINVHGKRVIPYSQHATYSPRYTCYKIFNSILELYVDSYDLPCENGIVSIGKGFNPPIMPKADILDYFIIQEKDIAVGVANNGPLPSLSVKEMKKSLSDGCSRGNTATRTGRRKLKKPKSAFRPLGKGPNQPTITDYTATSTSEWVIVDEIDETSSGGRVNSDIISNGGVANNDITRGTGDESAQKKSDSEATGTNEGGTSEGVATSCVLKEQVDGNNMATGDVLMKDEERRNADSDTKDIETLGMTVDNSNKYISGPEVMGGVLDGTGGGYMVGGVTGGGYVVGGVRGRCLESPELDSCDEDIMRPHPAKDVVQPHPVKDIVKLHQVKNSDGRVGKSPAGCDDKVEVYVVEESPAKDSGQDSSGEVMDANTNELINVPTNDPTNVPTNDPTNVPTNTPAGKVAKRRVRIRPRRTNATPRTDTPSKSDLNKPHFISADTPTSIPTIIPTNNSPIIPTSIPTNDSPIVSTNDSPIVPTNDSPIVPTKDSPIPTNGSPIIPTNDSPIIPTNGSPIVPTNDSPIVPTKDSPIVPTNGSPIVPPSNQCPSPCVIDSSPSVADEMSPKSSCCSHMTAAMDTPVANKTDTHDNHVTIISSGSSRSPDDDIISGKKPNNKKRHHHSTSDSNAGSKKQKQEDGGWLTSREPVRTKRAKRKSKSLVGSSQERISDHFKFVGISDSDVPCGTFSSGQRPTRAKKKKYTKKSPCKNNSQKCSDSSSPTPDRCSLSPVTPSRSQILNRSQKSRLDNLLKTSESDLSDFDDEVTKRELTTQRCKSTKLKNRLAHSLAILDSFHDTKVKVPSPSPLQRAMDTVSPDIRKKLVPITEAHHEDVVIDNATTEEVVTISSDEETIEDARGHKLGPVLTAHISALFNGCSDINEISILTLKKWLKIRKRTLTAILTGKLHSVRHQEYRSGPKGRATLQYRISSEMLTKDQIKELTDLLHYIFCSKNEKLFSYMWLVLFPEAVIHLIMDFHNLSYHSAEEKMYNYKEITLEDIDL